MNVTQNGNPLVLQGSYSPGSDVMLDTDIPIPDPQNPLVVGFTAPAAGQLSFLFETPTECVCPSS